MHRLKVSHNGTAVGETRDEDKWALLIPLINKTQEDWYANVRIGHVGA